MSRRRPLRTTKPLILLLVLAAQVSAESLAVRERGADDRPGRDWATMTASRSARLSLQERVQEVNRRVSPSVVAVEGAWVTSTDNLKYHQPNFEPYASGVIITPDGLILSQAHVSHRLKWKPGEPIRSRLPGGQTSVILSDGRKIKAELLGADYCFDLSLLRLLDPGPHPYTPLDPSAKVGLGDWVVKFGHPLGYRRDRPPVVRLSRVLFSSEDIFVNDTVVIGGDSGGPYFDLEGRLVGIICSSVVPRELHDSLRNHQPGATRLGPVSSTTSGFIKRRMGELLRPQIVAEDRATQSRFFACFRDVQARDLLPPDQWTQGEATRKAFQYATQDSRPSVVVVLDEAGRDVALGTVVYTDGLVLTVASTLPAEPRCQLPDARVVPARVVGMDSTFDLALLKLPVSDLSAVKLSEEASPVAGTLLAAAGMSETPLAIGIVSVPERNPPGPFPTQISRPSANRPGVFGKSVAEGYLVDRVSLRNASEAGIRSGDVILQIAGQTIRDDEDIVDCVIGRVEGERVSVSLLRSGHRTDLTLELVAHWRVAVEHPTQFEHDMPLLPGQCGGPVLDLDDHAVGITVNRGQYGCIAIPAACIKRLLPALKAGRFEGRWIKPPLASPDSKP